MAVTQPIEKLFSKLDVGDPSGLIPPGSTAIEVGEEASSIGGLPKGTRPFGPPKWALEKDFPMAWVIARGSPILASFAGTEAPLGVGAGEAGRFCRATDPAVLHAPETELVSLQFEQYITPTSY